MDLRLKVLETIKKYNLLKEGNHVVLGLSGGPDSMCLFYVLYSLKDDLGITIHPVHINHCFRPGAADEDQAYVEYFTQSLGIKCKSFVIDCVKMAQKMGLTSEEAGRKARYDSFFKVCDELNKNQGISKENICVAVAHNANDQAETILFRILRGTSIDGLSGMQHLRENKSGYRIIRPILDIKRQEIETYCKEEKLNPRIDLTNDEAIYTRNKIRLELLPLIEKEFNPNIVETLNRLGRNAFQDSEFISEEAEKIAGREIFTENLKKLHKAIRFRVYTASLHRIGMTENITTAQLEAVDRILWSENPSAEVNLADGYRVSINYDRVVFYRLDYYGNDENHMKNWHIEEISSKEALLKIKKANSEGRPFGVFSAEEGLKAEMLEVRTRRDGDYLPLKHGNKKLQDFFVDSKIPKMYRDGMLLLARGREILWVLPSEHFKEEVKCKKGRFCEKYKAELDGSNTVIFLENI